MLKGSTFDKAILRSELITRRKNIVGRDIKAAAVTNAVLKTVAGNCLVYVSIGSELSTVDLIKRMLDRSDIKVFCPYTYNGVIYPLPLKKLSNADKNGNLPPECYDIGFDRCRLDEAERYRIDHCITPLLGFNSAGYRIGYGKGCYDRFFACTPCNKIGVAFDVQMIEFQNQVQDVPLDCCVTESKVLYF